MKYINLNYCKSAGSWLKLKLEVKLAPHLLYITCEKPVRCEDITSLVTIFGCCDVLWSQVSFDFFNVSAENLWGEIVCAKHDVEIGFLSVWVWSSAFEAVSNGTRWMNKWIQYPNPLNPLFISSFKQLLEVSILDDFHLISIRPALLNKTKKCPDQRIWIIWIGLFKLKQGR